MDLHVLGWNDFFQTHWNAHAGKGLQPARVVEEQKEAYRVLGEFGEIAAEITGRFRHKAGDRSEFPVVGDWVVVDATPSDGKGRVHEILPRRSKLSRKAAGARAVEQVLVSNVDVAFVVMSLNADLNPRRLERYLGTIWEGGALPVVLLSKADLCADRQSAAEGIEGRSPGVGIHMLSSRTGEGLNALEAYTRPGKTVVFLGSSGVGKSTLINRLLGSEEQKTLEIRDGDDRGRHATTYRRLFVLPGGGLLIDTPGMRELQLWGSDSELEDTFDEIGELSVQCRFNNCGHDTEPGCAVLEAIARGTLAQDRLLNYRKLKREQQFLDRRRDQAVQAEQKKIWKQRHRALKQHYKLKSEP